MGCCNSTSQHDAAQDEAAWLWPTAGRTPEEIMENVAFVRHDMDSWFKVIQGTDSDEGGGLNEAVLYRYIGSLWRHVERTVTSDNAPSYQEVLTKGYHYLTWCSRGRPIKHESDRRKLRTHMMFCALEVTAGILILQQDTRDENYQRRRQSLPIMAWTIIHRLANARMEAGSDPSAPWCTGLVVRTFPSVISSGRWEWQDRNSAIDPISKIVESAADGERLLLLVVDFRRRARREEKAVAD